MRTASLIVISLLLSQVFLGSTIAVEDPTTTIRRTGEVGAVKVYFVRNSFTSGEKLVLWEAIESFAKKAKKKGREISFVAAGETGGLIDCAGCLTIARHAPSGYANREDVSFNFLRHAEDGGLFSAWIGFQHEGTASNLRTLMLQALERGLAPSASQTAKARR